MNELLPALEPAPARLRALVDEVSLDIDAAMARFTADARHAAEARDGLALAAASLGLAVAYAERRDLRAALFVLVEGELAAGDHPIRIAIDLLKVKAQAIAGSSAAAIVSAHLGLDHARRWGDPHAEAVLLTNLGFVYASRNEPAPYAQHTREALALFRRLGDVEGTAHGLCNLAGALSSLGRLDEAMACYDESLALAQSIGWRRGEALILAGVGGLRCCQGRLDEGVAKYAESRPCLLELGDHYQVAWHDLLLGRYLSEAGQHLEALASLDLAAASAVEHDFPSISASVHEVRARSLQALGEFPAALDALRRHVSCREGDAQRNLEDQLRASEIEHRVADARREAAGERRRREALARVNEDLVAALARQQELQQELRALADTDALTGLYNRRRLEERLKHEWGRAARSGLRLAVLVVDVDNFKLFNDAYGHPGGDRALVAVGGALRRSAHRVYDVVGRWGGEEFLLLLPEADSHGASTVAERARAAVAELGIPHVRNDGHGRVTCSVGAASMIARRESDPWELVRSADRALYRAKRAGRNCVMSAEEPRRPRPLE